MEKILRRSGEYNILWRNKSKSNLQWIFNAIVHHFAYKINNCVWYSHKWIIPIAIKPSTSKLIGGATKRGLVWSTALYSFPSFDENGGTIIEKCYGLHSTVIAIHYGSIHAQEKRSLKWNLFVFVLMHGVHLSCHDTNCQMQCPAS